MSLCNFRGGVGDKDVQDTKGVGDIPLRGHSMPDVVR